MAIFISIPPVLIPAILCFATSSPVPVEHFVMGSDAPFPLGEPKPVTFLRKALPAQQADSFYAAEFRSPGRI